jgi:hypothetical protein
LSISAQAICGILDLDIGAIHLDLLGLVVDLAPIHLDITALGGAGNLLGNLLCAVAGLLDPGGFLIDLLNTLNQLLDLLDQINNLLGSSLSGAILNAKKDLHPHYRVCLGPIILVIDLVSPPCTIHYFTTFKI